MRKPGPNVLARFDENACDLWVVSQKMLDQVQTKILQALDGVLASHRIGGVFHRVSRDGAAIVSLHVRGLKFALIAYRRSFPAVVAAVVLVLVEYDMNKRSFADV